MVCKGDLPAVKLTLNDDEEITYPSGLTQLLIDLGWVRKMSGVLWLSGTGKRALIDLALKVRKGETPT